MAKAQTDINPALSSPKWCAEPRLQEHLAYFPAKVNASSFRDKDAVKVTVNATANQNATSVTIVAITFPNGITKIPSGTVLYFGGEKIATLSADYESGTTLSVLALPNALASADVAYYKPYGTRVAIQSGTLLGRTLTERNANTGFGPADPDDDEFYLLAYDIEDAYNNDNCELVRHGIYIKENYLPDWDIISTLANAVQSVAVAGTLSAGAYSFYDPRSGESSSTVAYGGNLAAIQAALDDIYGASNSVAAGTIDALSITFAADLAGIDMPLVHVIPDGLTGMTSITVNHTTRGGLALLNKMRSLYKCILGNE